MNSTEQHRLECEARARLRMGYTTPATVEKLRQRIAAKRGNDAARALIDEMRNQWQKMVDSGEVRR